MSIRQSRIGAHHVGVVKLLDRPDGGKWARVGKSIRKSSIGAQHAGVVRLVDHPEAVA